MNGLAFLREVLRKIAQVLAFHARPRRPRRVWFEPLEPRLAMTGDMVGDYLVDLSLSITRPDGSPAAGLAPGDEFLLHVTTEDLREEQRGVFAAYLDIEWDSALALVTGPIRYSNTYNNGKEKDTDVVRPGLLNDVGAFAGAAELGAGQFEVFVVPLRVTGSGELVFTMNPADVPVTHDILIFRSNAKVPVTGVRYGAAGISIAGSGLAANDFFSVQEDSTNAFHPLANDGGLGEAGSLRIVGIGPASQGGSVVVSADSKSLQYQPRANFHGVESFAYTVENQAGERRVVTITVDVLPDNDRAVAIADTFTVPVNSSANRLAVLTNDVAEDSGRDLRIRSIPATTMFGGSVTIDGSSLLYTNNYYLVGSFSFSYWIIV
jgi:hypothetical protein